MRGGSALTAECELSKCICHLQDIQASLTLTGSYREEGRLWLQEANRITKMASTTPCLVTYSIVTTVVAVTLGILYHSCGSDDLENNSGTVDKRTEIGLIYDDESCDCNTTISLSVLEGLVILVLICVAIGLMVKAILHVRNGWRDQKEKRRAHKERKSLKLREEMMAELAESRKSVENADNDSKDNDA